MRPIARPSAPSTASVRSTAPGYTVPTRRPFGASTRASEDVFVTSSSSWRSPFSSPVRMCSFLARSAASWSLQATSSAYRAEAARRPACSSASTVRVAPRDRTTPKAPKAAASGTSVSRRKYAESLTLKLRAGLACRSPRYPGWGTSFFGRTVLEVECLADDAVLLAQVRRRVALARARAPRAADVAQRTQPAAPPRAGGGSRARRPCSAAPPAPRRPPRAPGSRRRARASCLDAGTDRAARRARPRRLGAPPRSLVADDVVVELPRAERRAGAPRPGRRAGSSMTGWNAPSVSSSSVDDASLQPQQPLRRHHDQRPRARVERLPPQQVEVLRRGRAVGDADVLLRGELQEALEPRGGVLGPVALVAVREQQRQP